MNGLGGDIQMIQALLAAGLWGGTDVFAGMSARRSTPLLAAVWLHLASIAVIGPYLALVGNWGLISWRDATFGILAGIIAAIGDVLFGRSLSKTSMTIGIPLANVIAAAIPALVAIALGDHVTLVGCIGISGALLASALAVAPSNGHLAVEGAGYAAVAGVCFGIMYGLLAHVQAGGSLPVIFLMRCAGTFSLLPSTFRASAGWTAMLVRGGIFTGVLSGITSVGANWLFVLAMSSGSRVTLSVVAIAFSAPIGMLIVNLIGRERLTAVQGFSAIFAVMGIAFLAIPKTML